MTPPDTRDISVPPPSRYTAEPPDAFTAWIVQKGYESATRLRWPVVLASSRLHLGSRRCEELQRDIDDLRDRLLNASPLIAFEHRSELERRLMQAQSALHAERLTVWRDLLPLSRELRDAAMEDMRQGFLSELTRLIGESAEGPRSP
jgi:hypothetical protein